jgi:hypothetical protein
MRILYPADTFSPKRVDEIYADEYTAAKNAGLPISIFNYEDFLTGGFKPSPSFESGETILYRGWMMSESEYQRLVDCIHAADCKPLTSVDVYLLCHHLPRWYPVLRDYTAETRFYVEDADIAADLAAAGWNGCFLKDYVKSLSTDGGSLITDLSAISQVIAKMRKYRGQIEGGICARRIESYDQSSEKRFFVFRGKVLGGSAVLPAVVGAAVEKIHSPFFTVDVAERSDGETRIIELGDGQVSDRKHWSSEDFIRFLAEDNH